MAIAGLHNLSVLDSSFVRDSQSSTARERGDNGRSSARASSVLQMWRELEDEHVVSRVQQDRANERLIQQRTDGSTSDLLRADASNNGSESRGDLEDVAGVNDCEAWLQEEVGSENEHEDHSDLNSEHSSDFGEVERERVRKIFREWMNSGAKERSSNSVHVNTSSRADWLGETEQERVRIIRGWVQLNSQQRGPSRESREEQTAEIGAQIERVLDGQVANQNEGRSEHSRRGIRRLCGRQALLDMLKKAEKERHTELQSLMERHTVSQFSHRNRIQSLLRGRFLRNDRAIRDEKPTSTAASELGLLWQKHTVSGLREGFFSRLDSAGSQGSSNLSDTSSDSDINCPTNDRTLVNNSDMLLHDINGPSESLNVEVVSTGVSSVQSHICENRSDLNTQETTDNLEECERQVSDNQVRDWQHSGGAELIERGDGWLEGIHSDYLEASQIEAGNHSDQQGITDVIESEQIGEDSIILALSNETDNQEGQRVEEIPWDGSAAESEHWQEQVALNEQRDRQHIDVDSDELRDSIGEVRGDNHNSSTADGSQELSGSEVSETSRVEEIPTIWQEDHGLQDSVQGLLEGPSDQQFRSGRQAETFYLPDDGDNVYSQELRELVSRRSVSSLLHSSFRESLDQLIQSYVERQGHDPTNWEVQGTPPASAGHRDHEQHNGEPHENQEDDVHSPTLFYASPQMAHTRQLWDQESTQDNWPQHEMHHRFGIDWEVINDLRIDMARLQQRMNNMQRMLESCMDMQLELQRSIRQEVSAALNRSAVSSADCENNLPKDGSQWDHVKKGICCICCETSIDSLLYRCGHMCTCTNCATKLVQIGGKCPMCRAPVIEVIRAYSIL